MTTASTVPAPSTLPADAITADVFFWTPGNPVLEMRHALYHARPTIEPASRTSIDGHAPPKLRSCEPIVSVEIGSVRYGDGGLNADAIRSLSVSPTGLLWIHRRDIRGVAIPDAIPAYLRAVEPDDAGRITLRFESDGPCLVGTGKGEAAR